MLADSATRLQVDSVSEVVEIRTESVRVPLSEVMLTIATDSLRQLPEGASYADRSGQASVKVMRKAATATEPERIYVYASCDSLELQCERYERTLRNLRSEYGEQMSGLKIRLAESQHELDEVKARSKGGPALALAITLAIILIIRITLMTVKRLKNKNI